MRIIRFWSLWILGADITVVAEHVCHEMDILSKDSGDSLRIKLKKYDNKDIEGMILVVCATDDKELNHQIAHFCMSAGVWVNAVDQKEDCSFIFPSYVKEENLVAAFSSGGNSPLLTQILKEKEKEILTPEMGIRGEILGKYRSMVQSQVRDTKKQSNIYRLVSDELLCMADSSCELIYVGKENHNHTLPQDEINCLLYEKYIFHRGSFPLMVFGVILMIISLLIICQIWEQWFCLLKQEK